MEEKDRKKAEEAAQAELEAMEQAMEEIDTTPTPIEAKRPVFVAAVATFRAEHKAWKEDDSRDDEDPPLLKALENVVAAGRAAVDEMTPPELECFQWLDKAYCDVCDNIKKGRVQIFHNFLWLSWGKVSLAFRE